MCEQFTVKSTPKSLNRNQLRSDCAIENMAAYDLFDYVANFDESFGLSYYINIEEQIRLFRM